MVKKRIDIDEGGGGGGGGGFPGNVVKKAKSNPIASFLVAVVILGFIYAVVTNTGGG